MWIFKRIRVIFGRCPYCNEKLLTGIGGESYFSHNELKICPNRHYAEEIHDSGLLTIYDNDGKELTVNKWDKQTGEYKEKRTLY
jgi:hypothetical protein